VITYTILAIYFFFSNYLPNVIDSDLEVSIGYLYFLFDLSLIVSLSMKELHVCTTSTPRYDWNIYKLMHVILRVFSTKEISTRYRHIYA
jgi:hypothetical protein